MYTVSVKCVMWPCVQCGCGYGCAPPLDNGLLPSPSLPNKVLHSCCHGVQPHDPGSCVGYQVLDLCDRHLLRVQYPIKAGGGASGKGEEDRSKMEEYDMHIFH